MSGDHAVHRVAVILALTTACCGCNASPEGSSRLAPAARPASDAQRGLVVDPPTVASRETRFRDDVESNVDLARTGIESVSFVDLDGRQRTLEEFWRDHLVVLVVMRGDSDFDGPWCVAHAAQLIENYREFVARRAEVVLVYPVAPTGTPDLNAFLEAFRNRTGDPAWRTPFPVLLDPGSAGVEQLGIRGKPATYIVDRSGVVRFAHVGVDPADRPSVVLMLAQLDQLRSEQDPFTPPDTGPIRERRVAGAFAMQP